MSSKCEDELTGRLFIRKRDCWDLGRTNSPTSAKHGDGLRYIRIWATQLRRLVFWDGLLGWCPESLQFSLPFHPHLLVRVLPSKVERSPTDAF